MTEDGEKFAQDYKIKQDQYFSSNVLNNNFSKTRQKAENQTEIILQPAQDYAHVEYEFVMDKMSSNSLTQTAYQSGNQESFKNERLSQDWMGNLPKLDKNICSPEILQALVERNFAAQSPVEALSNEQDCKIYQLIGYELIKHLSLNKDLKYVQDSLFKDSDEHNTEKQQFSIVELNKDFNLAQDCKIENSEIVLDKSSINYRGSNTEYKIQNTEIQNTKNKIPKMNNTPSEV
jgi:hypothetical protein